METTTHTKIPYIGRTVIYRSRIDNGEGNDVLSPAVVIRTRGTTVKAVVDRWGEKPDAIIVEDATEGVRVFNPAPRPAGFVAELPDEMTVDLLVHGLGQDYREYCVPYSTTDRGAWSWPIY